MRGIAESQKFLSDTYHEIKAKLDQFDTVSKELETVKMQLIAKDVVINDLSTRLSQLEQYGRRAQLEINGVTETQQENVEEILVKVAADVGVNLSSKDIAACHRLPTRDARNRKTPNPIIVEFVSRKTRDSILQKRYDHIITNKKIGILLSGPKDERIYINESLSPFFKKLLWLAKTRASSLNYSYCWFRKDRVLAKKSELDSKVIIIQNESDLEKLK